MSVANFNTLKSIPLAEIPNQPATAVIDWLATQPDYIGEAIAKLCYQSLARQ